MMTNTSGAPSNGTGGTVTGALSPRMAQLLEETDAEFLVELIDLFRDDSAVLMSQITRAAAAREIKNLEHDAHTLKGAAANLGEEPLRLVCETIEHTCRDGKMPEAEVFSIHAIYDDTIKRLDLARTHLSGAPSQ